MRVRALGTNQRIAGFFVRSGVYIFMAPGRILIGAGITLAIVGIVLELAPSLRLGRLPGDISFGGQNWRVYIPIGTSILLSVILTLVFAAVSYFGSRR